MRESETAAHAGVSVSALQLLLTPPGPPRLLEPTRQDRSSRFVVVAAHGGAGASTVAAMLDPDHVGLAVEVPQELPAAGGCPVLVARTTAQGLARVVWVLADWPPGAPRPWLVLVPDAPAGLPTAARFRLRAVSGVVAGVARVRYLHRLRELDDPADALTDPAVARAAARLRAQLPAVHPTRNRRGAIA